MTSPEPESPPQAVAPTTTPPADWASTSPALRRVIVLMLVNLGVSVALAALVFALRNELIDYQVAHMGLAADADLARARELLQSTIWFRVAPVALIGLIYLFLIRRLRQGQRRAYVRVIALAGIGVAAFVLSLATAYPWWLHVAQGVQAAVLLALLWAVTRPEVRAAYPKR